MTHRTGFRNARGNVTEPIFDTARLRPEQQTGSFDDGLFVIPLRYDLMNTLGQVPAAIQVLPTVGVIQLTIHTATGKEHLIRSE